MMADGFQFGMVLTWARVVILRLCSLLPRFRLQLGNVMLDIRVELSIFASGVTFEDGTLVGASGFSVEKSIG